MTSSNLARIEEGAPPVDDEGANKNHLQSRLSVTSAKFDIDGKGVLNEAELAMRKLDKSNRGFLTNESVYKLMQEQFALQRSMVNMKKVIIGNLGTSFTAVYLAKETKTANGDLVDMKTNEVVATGQAVKMFTLNQESGDDAKARKLACLTSTNMDGTSTVNCDVVRGTTMNSADALELLNKCHTGSVNVQLVYTEGTQVTQKPVCGTSCTSSYTIPLCRKTPTAGVLCIPNSPNEKLYINPMGDMYEVTSAAPSEMCTEEYNPVCGCNEMTYSNACTAQNNGVIDFTGGECKPELAGDAMMPEQAEECDIVAEAGANGCDKSTPYCVKGVCSQCSAVGNDNECNKIQTLRIPAPGRGTTTGYCVAANTPSGLACQSCKVEDGISIGCAESETCGAPSCIADLPLSCSVDHNARGTECWMPVCGNDGQTYSNRHEAGAAGVTEYTEGECCEITNTANATSVCGQAGASMFCELATGHCNRRVNPFLGVCASRLRKCSDYYEPVCGCDGKNYDNECQAHASGMSISRTGTCPTLSPTRKPTQIPTSKPVTLTKIPTSKPTAKQAFVGQQAPSTGHPTTKAPTLKKPSKRPTKAPTKQPTSKRRTKAPTKQAAKILSTTKPTECVLVCPSAPGTIDKDVMCPMNYDPVCDCNGNLWSNACVATNAGITSFCPAIGDECVGPVGVITRASDNIFPGY